MKLSSIIASSILLSAISAAPLHTVYSTTYVTVIVNLKGETLVPAPTPEPTVAPEAPAPAPEPVAEAPVPVNDPAPKAVDTPRPPIVIDATETPAPPPPAPTPEPTVAAPVPEPTVAAAPAASSNLNHGEGTFYDAGLGACGIVNSGSDYVIAVSHGMFDANMIDGNPNNNPLCGKRIRAYYEGKSVDVTIVDRCEACAYNDLDFSSSAFSQLGSFGLGRIPITWEWL
ncbi:uncharacterized protein J8A68_001237 [[Candida] subhashii]|uniref:RlpA-like protein double-psi beta-barrel domain-containing protein n=1 Tax=[Candida] subhashii TaxID=561895 RepID=A0A8J5QIC8_9ASCO|nr:uncharacterized protein J8A68_001237 [[Candida] subhashii]KAG7665181.1 hypothetical protein J8A68_001237 [[Candida] subhashii]